LIRITNKRVNNSVNLNLYSTLLSYNSVFAGGGFTPFTSLDYNEPRTYDGRYFETLRYFYVYAGLSSDYRKRVAIDFTQNFSNFVDKYRFSGYNTDLGLRLRVTNSLSLKYQFSYYFDPFNIGFAVADSLGNPVFGARKLITYVNALTASYIFTKDMSISLNARHYWNTGYYKQYFNLLSNGQLAETNTYTQDNNFSYNAFNIDLVYSWRFAPGSVLSIVYKNAIENNGLYTDSKFANNFRSTISSPQVNSLSVKLLYYLDYLYLRKNTTI
jgi:hypothetical protein